MTIEQKCLPSLGLNTKIVSIKWDEMDTLMIRIVKSFQAIVCLVNPIQVKLNFDVNRKISKKVNMRMKPIYS